MTKHSIDILLSQFGTSLLLHVQFKVLILDLHTTFQEAGKVLWYSHLFKNFPQFIVIQTVKGFGIVNKTEIDVCLEHSCFFYDQTDAGSLTSGSFTFSKSRLNIWKFMVHVLLKPDLDNFEYYFASVC